MITRERTVLACVADPARQFGDTQMTSYSVTKVGSDYVVQADDQCILKVTSRRRAAQLITEAVLLLKAEAAAPSHGGKRDQSSLGHETSEVP